MNADSDLRLHKGRVVRWQDEKGYGFINCRELPKDVFFHIRDYHGKVRRPDVGETVRFVLYQDEQGRFQARQVYEAGAETQPSPPHYSRQERKCRNRLLQEGQQRNLLIAGVSVLLLCVLALAKLLPLDGLLWYAFVNTLTVSAYWKDKAAAQRGSWRTPENTLHLLSLAGGWIGALLAQTYLRHKSQKQPFRTIYFLTVAGNLLLLGYWLVYRPALNLF